MIFHFFQTDVAFSEPFDPAYKDPSSSQFKERATKIEDALLPPIQARIPQVDAVKVLALTEGSTVATIDMILKPGTAKGAVKATEVATKLPTVLNTMNVVGLTPHVNQKLAVVAAGSYSFYCDRL